MGWTATEEVDVVRPGRNYGWPCYEGPFRTTTVQDDSRCSGQYAAEGTANAALGPIHSYPHANGGSSITGGPVYEATAFPAEFRGDVFFADYVKGFIKRLELDGSDQVTAVRDFASGGGGIVDLQVTPGGALAYVDINGGAVRQIRYVSSANRPPIAQASANPTAGPLPLAVNLSGLGSSDPDGDTLRFQWDFGDGTPGSTARDPSHTYSTAGRFTARLTVTDGRGGSDSQTVTIDAGNRPPSVTLNAPPTYRAGQQVTVSGSAVDPEDGQLPNSALEWDIRLIHIDHEHEADDPVGVGSTSFTAATDHDADSRYEVTLTARDSGGVTGSKTATMLPETIALTLDSSPSGAPLSYTGRPVTAPDTAARRSGSTARCLPPKASRRTAAATGSWAGPTVEPEPTS